MSKASIDNLEWYYNNYNVYRSLVICNSDKNALDLCKSLTELNHSIYTITTNDLGDEREVYMKHLRQFKKQHMYRMLIVSYEVFIHIRDYIEAYVLPEQNLLVFDEISDDSLQYILRWIKDAKNRGFITRDDCTVLTNVDEKFKFSVI
jgi:hypothetical protein